MTNKRINRKPTNGVSFPPTIEIPRPTLPLGINIVVGFSIIIGFLAVASSSSSTGSRTRTGESAGETIWSVVKEKKIN